MTLITGALARGDAAAYAQPLKERDAVLCEIVAQEESQFSNGVVNEDALFEAKLTLFSFRRDSARANEERAKQQALIVGLFEKRMVLLKARIEVGLVGPVERLKAIDDVLAAKQELERLKLAKAGG